MTDLEKVATNAVRMMNENKAEAERYAAELDKAAAMLQKVHYIGLVKAIGRLEVVKALEDILADYESLRDARRQSSAEWSDHETDECEDDKP